MKHSACETKVTSLADQFSTEVVNFAEVACRVVRVSAEVI